MRFRKKPIVALSMAGLLALAACTGGSTGDNAGDIGRVPSPSVTVTSERMDPDRQGPVSIAGAKEGGVVTVLTAFGLTTPLDPSDAYYTDTMAILTGLVTRQLTQYSYDQKSGQMVLVPDLATDLGTPNDDFTRWEFTLRDDVRWETGEPITAEEVAFGINRSMDSKTFPNGPGLTYSTFFLGGDEYEGPYTSGENTSKAVEVEGNTITVRMSKPFPDFRYYASMPAMGPIPLGEVSDPATYARRPLASGPYKIKSYAIARSLVLERNEEWDPATDPGRTQYPDGYEFKAGQSRDRIDQILLADSGEGQSTLTDTDIQAKNYPEFQSEHPDRLVVGGSPCHAYYALDMRKMKDKKVREAFLWAVPYKDQLIAAGLISGVTAIPATNVMPPGIPGREEYNPVEGHDPFETDPKKAKQLLKESGNEGFEIKFLFRTDVDADLAVKNVLVKALEAAGFTATPVPTTTANFVADRDDPDGEINVRSFAWASDWLSGGTWIPNLFRSTDLDKVGFGNNLSAFNEAEIDRKIDEVLTLPASEQPAAWNALDKEIMTAYLPIVPRYYCGNAMAHGSRVHGHNNDNTLGEPTYKDLWVSSE